MSAADGASFVCVQVPPLMVEVEVVRSEHRSVHHPLEIEDLELLAVELDEAVAAKLLEGPVDVDRGEASRVGEVVLSQREIAAAVLRASDGSQTDVELDQQMRDPLVGAALSEAESPFALGRGGHQLVPPKRLRHARVGGGKSRHFLAR